MNQKFCTILGYTRDELLQRTCQDITHPDDLAAGVDALTALLRGESPGFALEKRYLRKDGSLVWVDLSVSLQRDGAGKPDYSIGVVQDISNRKRLEEELREAGGGVARRCRWSGARDGSSRMDHRGDDTAGAGRGRLHRTNREADPRN